MKSSKRANTWRGGKGGKLPKAERIPHPPLTVSPRATNMSDRGSEIRNLSEYTVRASFAYFFSVKGLKIKIRKRDDKEEAIGRKMGRPTLAVPPPPSPEAILDLKGGKLPTYSPSPNKSPPELPNCGEVGPGPQIRAPFMIARQKGS